MEESRVWSDLVVAGMRARLSYVQSAREEGKTRRGSDREKGTKRKREKNGNYWSMTPLTASFPWVKRVDETKADQ